MSTYTPAWVEPLGKMGSCLALELWIIQIRSHVDAAQRQQGGTFDSSIAELFALHSEEVLIRHSHILRRSIRISEAGSGHHWTTLRSLVHLSHAHGLQARSVPRGSPSHNSRMDLLQHHRVRAFD
eukprot:1778003-Amphidinium_carterae.1